MLASNLPSTTIPALTTNRHSQMSSTNSKNTYPTISTETVPSARIAPSSEQSILQQPTRIPTPKSQPQIFSLSPPLPTPLPYTSTQKFSHAMIPSRNREEACNLFPKSQHACMHRLHRESPRQGVHTLSFWVLPYYVLLLVRYRLID